MDSEPAGKQIEMENDFPYTMHIFKYEMNDIKQVYMFIH